MIANEKILDMRGPKMRVLNNLGELSVGLEDMEFKTRNLPELKYNIRQIVTLRYHSTASPKFSQKREISANG